MPAEEYRKVDAVSNSFLSDLFDYSPAHAVYFREHPQDETPSTRLGTALHVAALEPERFAEAYTLAGPCVAPLKSGDRKGEPCGVSGKYRTGGAWYCGTRGHLPAGCQVDQGLKTLTHEEYEQVTLMARNIRQHPAAFKLLTADGAAEVSLFWTDLETGVDCKARLDWIAWDLAIVDVKTCQCAKPEAFGADIWRRGYYRQAAMYSWAAAAVGRPVEFFAQIAVESNAPFGVSVQNYSDDYLAHGREKVRELLNVVAECQRTGHWPAYSSKVEPVSLPAWADRQLVSTSQE